MDTVSSIANVDALDVPDCVPCGDTGILVRHGRELVCPFCDEVARRKIVEQRMLDCAHGGAGALRSREVALPFRAPLMPGTVPSNSSNGDGHARVRCAAFANAVSVGSSVEFVRHFVVDKDGSEIKVGRGGNRIRGTWRMIGDCELHARRLDRKSVV